MSNRNISRLCSGLAGLLVAVVCLASLGPSSVEANSFAEPGFQKLWQGADQPVASGQSNRSWLWGPQPGWAGYESYAEARPDGQRLVQYFDKSRMEINDPGQNRGASWFVSNGLLTVELVSGQMQVGNSSYETRSPAAIPVAGDPTGNPGPTYAALAALTTTAASTAPNRSGQPLRETVNGQGQVGTFGPGSPFGANPPTFTNYAYYESTTGHNIAGVLWNWMQNIPGSNWLFALGYPISEPYWSRFSVGGQSKMVLVQLFQRRALTFTPSNPAAFQVEMANIGQHYFAWRYGNTVPPAFDPLVLQSQEQALLDEVNRWRQSRGLSTLSPHPALMGAARWLSRDMADGNYVNHIDSQGRSTLTRLDAFNFEGGYKGENLFGGRNTAQEVVGSWEKSPPHVINLSSPNYKYAGIGYAYNPNSTYKWHWVFTFGA